MLLRRAIDVSMKLLGPLVLLALMMAVARVVLDFWAALRNPTIAGGFDTLATGILSTFVVIELLKSIADFAELHRIRITLIVDAAAVFTLREVMIGLYRRELSPSQIAALALLLLVVGVVRTLAVLFSPGAKGGEA